MNLLINGIGLTYDSVHTGGYGITLHVCFLIDKKHLSLFVNPGRKKYFIPLVNKGSEIVYQHGGAYPRSMENDKHWYSIPINMGYYIFEDVYGMPGYFEIKMHYKEADKKRLNDAELRDLRLNLILYDN